jgi:multidrug efflux pump subunit AcrA (membrane-fusion protein)
VTFEVKIEVTSEDKSLLMPEMTANVEIIVNSKDNVVQVPVEAIFYKDRKQPQVTLAGKEGAPGQAVPVEIGISDGSMVEIVKGVEEGQTVEVRKGAADSKWTAGQQPAQPPRGMMFPGGGGRPR